MRLRSSWLALALIAAAGGLLMGMALPRTLASLARLPGDAVLFRLSQGETVSPSALAVVAESRNHALAIMPAAGDHSDLALVYLSQAPEAASRSERQALYDAAAEAARETLRRNPADAHGWLRLAYAEYLQGGASERMSAALALALRGGAYDRHAVFTLVELALAVWWQLDADTRARADEQIRFALRRDATRLARLARLHFAAPMVRAALLDDPVARARFEAAYRGF